MPGADAARDRAIGAIGAIGAIATMSAVDGTVFEHAKALFFEGVAAFEAGRFDDAEARFEASLALVPGRASTLANLGAARVHAGRFAAALPVLDETLALEPRDLDSWSYRGVALAALHRHEESLACHDRVLEVAPDRATSWLRRGEALQFLERHGEALDAYERATTLAPTLAAAWTQRGSVLRDQGRLAEARHAFEQALAHGGDAELNRYFLASTRGSDAPAQAPAAYVQSFFDEYAPSFDRHLVDSLGYRAPEALVTSIGAAFGGRRFASALDLGCGTGLCGPLLEPMCERLEGVDLSARMLDQAAARSVYDELVRADLTAHLGTTTRRHDLVVAADVFIYVGDIAPVFEGVARVLDDDGVFAFTAEAGDKATDFTLLPSLRYAHRERYLRSLAGAHGFEITTLERAPLREEQKRPVDGFFVLLHRPADGA